MPNTFASHPLVRRETSTFEAQCACTQRIEAGRAQLHASLDRVLVIDMRMMWNGVGNSLTRWLAVLRLGTASGRATFLWMSDRELHRAKGMGNAAAGGMSWKGGPESRKQTSPTHFAGRRLARQYAPPTQYRRKERTMRREGFDLGDYFVAVGADYRWSRSAYRRVAAAMAARFNVTSPTLISYRCLHHTWACMKPMFEVGPMAAPEPDDDAAALDRGWAVPPTPYFFDHESEKDGAILSWLASRKDPWLLLRLHEQTALEPSQVAAHAALSGAWLGRVAATTAAAIQAERVHAQSAAKAAGAGIEGSSVASSLWQDLFSGRLATHECGACLEDASSATYGGRRSGRTAAASATADSELCVRDGLGRSGWRPSSKPTDPKELAAYIAISRPIWAQGLRVLRRLRRGARQLAIATPCETYAVLRPRPWLQRAMLPYLRRLHAASGGGPIVGLHMRTGFADWQWYSASRAVDAARNKRVAGREWVAAAAASPLPYAQHWRTFESMLLDCTDPTLRPGTPCFNWRTPRSRASPTVNIARAVCASHLNAPPLRMPGNGTLSAAVECVHRFALQLAMLPLSNRADRWRAGAQAPRATAAAEASAASDRARAWGVLVLGDAPGYISLVRSLPALDGRAVETNDAGEVAHTTFTGSCPPDSSLCVQAGTHNPHGGWTRAMVDYYLGGLTDGFVSSLFSSFVGAVLRRSLICCRERMHFGAMYSQQHSHRDKPMRNVDFLRALMQKHEVNVEDFHWVAST